MYTQLYAIAILLFLASVLGGLLGFSIIFFRADGKAVVNQIDEILPQTQCGQCGYPGCRPYAEAIAKGEAINKCPPGGKETINSLADLLGVAPQPLDSEHGKESAPTIAYIREVDCIGCTKCIQACPVDAIIGAARQMHTVIANECTGCNLCVEPCPVDCIEIHPTLPNFSEDLNKALTATLPNIITTDTDRS